MNPYVASDLWSRGVRHVKSSVDVHKEFCTEESYI